MKAITCLLIMMLTLSVSTISFAENSSEDNQKQQEDSCQCGKNDASQDDEAGSDVELFMGGLGGA